MGVEGGARAAIALRAALAVLFAGILAIPAQLAASNLNVQVGMGPTPPAPTASTATPPFAVTLTAADLAAADQPLTPPNIEQLSGPVQIVVGDEPGGEPVVVPTGAAPLAEGASSATNVFALIIGINDYPGRAVDLRSAVADADDMATALLRYNVPSGNILELVDQAATVGGILSGIQWLEQVAGPSSTAVIYYSGHARKVGPGTEAIVAADGILIPDWYLAGKLSTLQARDTWIVMASCYGGGFDELMQGGRILTAASDANSLAYENEGFGRSYLGEYLVRRGLLQGKAGGPTVQQAFAWAQATLQRDAPARALTQIDMSWGPISLDGVQRTSVPPVGRLDPPRPATPGGGSGGGGSGQPPAPPPAAPPTTALPVTCKNLLGLLCPPGTR